MGKKIPRITQQVPLLPAVQGNDLAQEMSANYDTSKRVGSPCNNGMGRGFLDVRFTIAQNALGHR